MRGRFRWSRDRAIGVGLGIVLGIAVILIFLFLGSRKTIDEPSLSGGATQTQPAAPPAPTSTRKAKAP
jgi:hypothetical protein